MSNTRSEMAALDSVLHTCMARTPLEVAAGAGKLLGVLGQGAECWGHSLGRTQLMMPGLRKDTVPARAPLSHSPAPYPRRACQPVPSPARKAPGDAIWGQPSHPVPMLAPSSAAFTLPGSSVVLTPIPGESPFLLTVCLPHIPPGWLTPAQPSSSGFARESVPVG